MKNIELIEEFDLDSKINSEKEKDARRLFIGHRRLIMEVTLTKGAVLSKHKAAEPITVLCLAGTGKFFAGEDLENEQELRAGTFLTLEAEIPHEVIAKPDLIILVTKFKQD